MLTTTLNVLGINSLHALAPSLQLGVDLGATRERFDDPTGFTINGRNRVQQAGVQLQWDVAANQLLQGGIERKNERFDDNSGVEQKRDTDVLRGTPGVALPGCVTINSVRLRLVKGNS